MVNSTERMLRSSGANLYLKTAAHPELSKAAHGQHLPASWRTLYELTKIEPYVLKSARLHQSDTGSECAV
jgi:hypothetical protein